MIRLFVMMLFILQLAHGATYTEKEKCMIDRLTKIDEKYERYPKDGKNKTQETNDYGWMESKINKQKFQTTTNQIIQDLYDKIVAKKGYWIVKDYMTTNHFHYNKFEQIDLQSKPIKTAFKKSPKMTPEYVQRIFQEAKMESYIWDNEKFTETSNSMLDHTLIQEIQDKFPLVKKDYIEKAVDQVRDDKKKAEHQIRHTLVRKVIKSTISSSEFNSSDSTDDKIETSESKEQNGETHYVGKSKKQKREDSSNVDGSEGPQKYRKQ